MSVYTTIFAGSTPIGALFAGALASRLGAVAALAVGGVMTIAVGAIAILWLRQHRTMAATAGRAPIPVPAQGRPTSFG